MNEKKKKFQPKTCRNTYNINDKYDAAWQGRIFTSKCIMVYKMAFDRVSKFSKKKKKKIKNDRSNIFLRKSPILGYDMKEILQTKEKTRNIYLK